MRSKRGFVQDAVPPWIMWEAHFAQNVALSYSQGGDMKCLKCGSGNSPDAKFCRACGDNLDEQRKAALLEKERLAQERKKQIQLWRDRLWGNRRAKIRSLTTGGAALLFAVIVGVILIRRDAEQRARVARTALFLQAVDSGNWAAVPELVGQGVDVNNVDASGHTPLVEAILKNNLESNAVDKASLAAATSLIEHGANVNADSPLSITQDPTIVSLLLSHGAAIDAKDNDGATPLFRAACGGPEKVNQLIASHADVNVQTNSGDTPLHNAASCGSLPVVKALIEHGAQINVTNQQGKTPLDSSFGHPEISVYLKAHGATGQIPIQLSTLTEQRKKPAYNAVFMTLFSGRFDVPSWLRESGYGGVEFNGRVVVIGGAKYELFVVCKPHDCSGNFLHVLFTLGGGAAWALTTENGGNFRFYGNPDQGLQAFLTSESRRNGRGEW